MKLINFLINDLGEIQTIGTAVVLLIAVILYVIQNSKLEVNPYTCIARLIKKVVGIKHIAKRVDNLEADLQEFEFQICKANILIFAQGLRDKESFSDLDWLIVFDSIDRYKALGIADSLIESEIDFIKKAKI